MDSSLEILWSAYLDAERRCIRGEIRSTLDGFIATLLVLPENVWRSWAFEIARLVVDEGKDIPVRHPLYQQVVCPALVDGVLAHKPGCARWLIYFRTQLHGDPELLDKLPGHLQSIDGLLDEAIRLDPDDSISRMQFIEWCKGYLEFTLHELPSGILYGMDGATADECTDLIDLLQRFRTQVEFTGQLVQYDEFIGKCAFHFTAYQEYLSAGKPKGSYAQFLQKLQN